MSADNEKQSIKKQESISDVSDREVKHIDNTSVNVKLANPLSGIPHDQLMEDAALFAKSHGLGELEEEFKKGALVAQDPENFEKVQGLDAEELTVLREEKTHKWRQPWALYMTIITCSIGAAVQ